MEKNSLVALIGAGFVPPFLVFVAGIAGYAPPASLLSGLFSGIALSAVAVAAVLVWKRIHIADFGSGSWLVAMLVLVTNVVFLLVALMQYRSEFRNVTVQLKSINARVVKGTEFLPLVAQMREEGHYTDSSDAGILDWELNKPTNVWKKSGIEANEASLFRKWLLLCASIALLQSIGAAFVIQRQEITLPSRVSISLTLRKSRPETPRRFAIALSLPSEHLAFVRRVAEALAVQLTREKVFFYEWYQAELLGSGGDLKLQSMYKQAELVVPFFSRHYDKPWCSVEWETIRGILLTRREDDAVIPVHLDDTQIAGWSPVGFGIELQGRTAEEIAGLLLEALEVRRKPSAE